MAGEQQEMRRLSVYVYDPLDAPVDLLVERGVEVTLGAPLYSPGRSRPKIPPAELIAAATGHAALLGASGTMITRAVMEGIGTLRCISKLGIGYEVIDVEAATDLGILVTNTPVHGEIGPVAEHAVALMLALAKQLHWYTPSYLAGGGWKDPGHMSTLLGGATVGIVGLGRIGRSVAARLANWDCRLLANDPFTTDSPAGVRLVDLKTLLVESDIVTLHAPGLPAGEGPLLNDARLGLMKPTALLVNTARGNLVDQDALVRRLGDGKLGGAALDVFSPEPPPADAPVLTAPNLIATPHMSAWSARIRKEMVNMALEDLWKALNGAVPEHLVNPAVLERLR
jgi:D-3-phosphoglycerate dehydrogenase